jgi:hypothetical protein
MESALFVSSFNFLDVRKAAVKRELTPSALGQIKIEAMKARGQLPRVLGRDPLAEVRSLMPACQQAV